MTETTAGRATTRAATVEPIVDTGARHNILAAKGEYHGLIRLLSRQYRVNADLANRQTLLRTA